MYQVIFIHSLFFPLPFCVLITFASFFGEEHPWSPSHSTTQVCPHSTVQRAASPGSLHGAGACSRTLQRPPRRSRLKPGPSFRLSSVRIPNLPSCDTWGRHWQTFFKPSGISFSFKEREMEFQVRVLQERIFLRDVFKFFLLPVLTGHHSSRGACVLEAKGCLQPGFSFCPTSFSMRPTSTPAQEQFHWWLEPKNTQKAPNTRGGEGSVASNYGERAVSFFLFYYIILR